jgi:lipid-binding SYLF domain-containing protein
MISVPRTDPFSFLRRFTAVLLLAVLSLTEGTLPAAASDSATLRDLVDKARITMDSFVADSNFTWFRDHVKDAKAVLIVPQLLKAAFFFGGSGGSGVLLVRDEKTGEWSEPAFYTLGAGSFGLQFGAQASEVILLIMTQKGVESMLSTTFTLGADATVAVGPVGGGVEGATAPNLSADLLSFARSKGLFAGISLEGAVVAAMNDDNSTYYGKTVRPTDIIVRRDVSNAHSTSLRAAVAKAVSGAAKPSMEAEKPKPETEQPKADADRAKQDKP